VTFLNTTPKPGSWISAIQPFAFANSRISFSRATSAVLFFGGPTKFKAILENHAPFLLLQALSNEFGKLVLRVRRVWSFLRHVLGGDDPGLYFSKEHTGINRGSSAKKCRNGDDGLNALESTRRVSYSPNTAVVHMMP